MATFLTDLFNSIFTPGVTPSIVIATNTSFAALQLVLFLLLAATYSVHFVILSCLSAGLWWGVNWFVKEMETENQKAKDAKHLDDMRIGQGDRGADGSGTETEGDGDHGEDPETSTENEAGGFLSPDGGGELRKRRSLGEGSSGDISTDSEWDKVEEAGEVNKEKAMK